METIQRLKQFLTAKGQGGSERGSMQRRLGDVLQEECLQEERNRGKAEKWKYKNTDNQLLKQLSERH